MAPTLGPHPDLLAAQELVYDPCGFTCSAPVPEAESAEYAAAQAWQLEHFLPLPLAGPGALDRARALYGA